MSRVYSANFQNVVVSAAQDIFQLLTPSGSSLSILEFGVYRVSALAPGTDEILSLREAVYTGGADGSGGSTASISGMHAGDIASSTIVETNNTTVTTGTESIHRVYGWDTLYSGFEKVHTPDAVAITPRLSRWALRLSAAPVAPLTLSGYVIFNQIGI